MTLSRETDLGKISISNVIFAEIIKDSFEQEECAGKVWPATKKGRQIGSDAKFNINEFAGNMEVDRAEDGTNIDIEFSVIVKFGTSIKSVTDSVSDYIADEICRRQGKKPNQIKIRISGVKSRQIARRSLEVIKQYGAE